MGDDFILKTVNIGGLCFGEGLPKICVPLVGGGAPALLREAQLVSALPADLYEWRADTFFGDPAGLINEVKQTLNKPLLYTLRTKGEGGEAALSPLEYEEITARMLGRGPDLIDIELSCGEERAARLARLAHEKGVGVVMSRHNFTTTPSKEELVASMVKMKELGADLPKYAVTPKTGEDVLTLLSATWEASRQLGPVITMSMGSLGKITRVSGGVFGSCLTFGAGESASAPGQIGAEDLKAILEDLNPET